LCSGKEYDKLYINDPDMKQPAAEKYETTFRCIEAAAGQMEENRWWMWL
jgi:hypothetical protein